MKQHRSACPLDCWDACAFIVETDDQDRITAINGDPDHPVTQGFVCQKAGKLLDRNSSPNRLSTPLLRKKGQLVPVGWDEALDLWTAKMREILDNHSPHSVLWYNDYGSSGMLKNLEARFFNLLGGVTRPRGSLCWAAGIAAQEADFGAAFSHPPEDILNAGCVVVWGKNPALTSIHSHGYLVQAKQKGIPIIVIDPVVTKTAGIADVHIQPFPGSDGWLALGLARVLVDKGVVDSGFIADNTENHGEYSKLLEEIELDTVTAHTGATREQIQQLAEFLANNKPVQFHLGYGLQRYHDSFNTVRHIDALAAIAGSIGVKGGGVNYANTFWDDVLDYEALTLKAQHRTFPKPELGQFLMNSEIKMMVVSRANPLVQAPDINSVRAGFKKVPFKVVLDLWLTDTAQEADLVLPCTSFLEEEDIYMSNMWQPVMNYAKPVAAPFGESKTEGEIYYLLAKRLGLDFPQHSPREWLERVLAPAKQWGVTLEKLEQQSLGPDALPLPWSQGKFRTKSGKFEFTPTLPDRLDLADGELLLLTPHRGGNMHSQFFPGENGEHLLELSASTAQQNLIAHGDLVGLKSSTGQITVRVKVSERVPSRVGLIYQGSQCQGEVVNMLTDPRPTKVGDGATYNQCICRIIKQEIEVKAGVGCAYAVILSKLKGKSEVSCDCGNSDCC